MSMYSTPSTSRRQQPLLPEFSAPGFSPRAPFNPKSVTEAAEVARNAPPKPKPNGPLVNLDFPANSRSNRMALRDGRCPVSKAAITWARYTSIVLRLAQLLGAMGLLVMMLMMRGMDSWTGWICRVPPAVAIVHVVYAIYHLSGSYRLKTPGSSKVYFLLASSVDVAIVCFYAFMAVLSWRQHAAGRDMNWTTVFHDDSIDQKIVFTVFLAACAGAGLTFITLGCSLYLVHAFRKLDSLPPDYNPFVEDEDPHLAVNEKLRWSSSTADSETALLQGKNPMQEQRTRPFAATRIKLNPSLHKPPPHSEGKYHYESLNFDELDLGTRRDTETLGAGYGQAPSVPEPERSPTKTSLKRGSRVVRPSSISSMPGTPTSLKRASISTYATAAEQRYDETVPIPESQRSSVISHTSTVQGYSKQALLAAKQEGREWRFRKVSGEAH